VHSTFLDLFATRASGHIYTVLFQVLQQLKRLIVAAADATHALHAHQKGFNVTLKDLQRNRIDLEIMCEAFACGMCLCTADKRFYQRFSPYLGVIGKCDVVWVKQTRVASSD
jgi:predicted nuclease of predicted toxin-antitoxin system